MNDTDGFHRTMSLGADMMASTQVKVDMTPIEISLLKAYRREIRQAGSGIAAMLSGGTLTGDYTFLDAARYNKRLSKLLDYVDVLIGAVEESHGIDEESSEGRMEYCTCPVCGAVLVPTLTGKIPTHDHPKPTRRVCPGSGEEAK